MKKGTKIAEAQKETVIATEEKAAVITPIQTVEGVSTPVQTVSAEDATAQLEVSMPAKPIKKVELKKIAPKKEEVKKKEAPKKAIVKKEVKAKKVVVKKEVKAKAGKTKTAQMIEMHNAGKDIKTIMEKLDCYYSQVSRIIKKLGVTKKKK
jgi:hypothetical protein